MPHHRIETKDKNTQHISTPGDNIIALEKRKCLGIYQEQSKGEERIVSGECGEEVV